MAIGPPYLRYSIFKIWPWKFKVNDIAQDHKVGITPYQLISISFHVDRDSHSWDTAISKFDVENSRSRVRSKLKITTWVQHSVNSYPFRPKSIGHPIPELRLFQNLTLKIKGQFMCEVTVQSHNLELTSYRLTSLSLHGNRPSHSWDTAFSKFDLNIRGQSQMTMMLHNYKSRQFHRTSNCINPSSGFRDMGSAISGPRAAWFDKFLAHGPAQMGQMGKQLWRGQLQV